MKVTAITTWEGTPAALLLLTEASRAAAEIHRSCGAKNPRLLQSMVGGNPAVMNYAMDFDSLEEYTVFIGKVRENGWWEETAKAVANAYPDLKMAGQTLLANAIE